MGTLAQRRGECPICSVNSRIAERGGSVEDRNRRRVDVVRNCAGQGQLAVVARQQFTRNRHAWGFGID